MDLKNRAWACGLDSCDWGQGLLAGCYERGNESAGLVKCRSFLFSWATVTGVVSKDFMDMCVMGRKCKIIWNICLRLYIVRAEILSYLCSSVFLTEKVDRCMKTTLKLESSYLWVYTGNTYTWFNLWKNAFIAANLLCVRTSRSVVTSGTALQICSYIPHLSMWGQAILCWLL
jgi:hypothetical protein